MEDVDITTPASSKTHPMGHNKMQLTNLPQTRSAMGHCIRPDVHHPHSKEPRNSSK
jgi:hypothetical protein